MAINFPNSPTTGQVFTVNDKTWQWQAPVPGPYPTDGNRYEWNENVKNWEVLQITPS